MSVFAQRKGALLDAVLLNDSTRVFGKVVEISDFILEMKVEKEKKPLTYASEDVDYVMVSPNNRYLIRTLKKEIKTKEKDFKELMDKDQIFGFTFIFGDDTLMNNYQTATVSDTIPFDRHKYVYDVQGKTMNERLGSLAKKGGAAAGLLLLLLLL
jgi:cellobiose-specific phosphotransferase system component IIB